jgi:bacteriorhodopsin
MSLTNLLLSASDTTAIQKMILNLGATDANGNLLPEGMMSTPVLTSFTFFIGCMAMMAASVFFFFEMWNVEKKWRTSLLVSGLITFIAFIHYYYMRDFHMNFNQSPTFLRYVDWTLTVPLMCVEFYLITKKAGAKLSLLWKLIFASVVMLVTGYFGEALDTAHSWQWGAASGAAYFYIVYIVWKGEVAQLAASAGAQVQKAVKVLFWFVLVGWAIYPLGYILGTPGGLFGTVLVDNPESASAIMDVVYNIGDAINKIGFGLVIYSLAVSSREEAA